MRHVVFASLLILLWLLPVSAQEGDAVKKLKIRIERLEVENEALKDLILKLKGDIARLTSSTARDDDPIESLKSLMKRVEGRSLAAVFMAPDKKWYRAELKTKDFQLNDVTKTDSLLRPFEGRISWKADVFVSAPMETQEQAQKAPLAEKPLPPRGGWVAFLSYSEGNWRLGDVRRSHYPSVSLPGAEGLPIEDPVWDRPLNWRPLFEAKK